MCDAVAAYDVEGELWQTIRLEEVTTRIVSAQCATVVVVSTTATASALCVAVVVVSTIRTAPA